MVEYRPECGIWCKENNNHVYEYAKLANWQRAAINAYV